MTGKFSRLLLSQISTMIATRFGLHFPPDRWNELERALLKAATDTDDPELKSLINSTHASHISKRSLENLINQLTVGETYFLRDKKLFHALRTEIFPELIRRRRGGQQYLRIWSAGCCTGEEPYSIAILLKEIIPDIDHWNITLLATDINPDFLRKMESGLYREWSFRDTSQDFRRRYFKAENEGFYRIDPAIQKMVIQDHLNLADDSYPSLYNNTNAMDIIICRNVMIYFVPDMIRKITDGFYRSLADGGYLVVGPSEVSSITRQGFTEVLLDGTILYRKGESLRDDRRNVQPEQEIEIPSTGTELFFNVFEGHDAATTEDRVKNGLPALTPDFGATAEGATPHRAETEPLKVLSTQSVSGPDPLTEATRLCNEGLNHEALKVLERSIKPGIDNPASYHLMARIHANMGYLDKAYTWCQKAVDCDKMNPALHYFQAIILQEQKHFEESVISLRSAIYLDPKFILAHAALGNVLAQLGKTAESHKSYRNAMHCLASLEPDSVVPESDGSTARHLLDHIKRVTQLHKHIHHPNPHEAPHGK